ncbi:MAG: phytanoyl-CoA dioxygenase family protein [Halopseudomonas aestusnigri]
MTNNFAENGVEYSQGIVPKHLLWGLLEEIIDLTGHKFVGHAAQNELFKLTEIALLEFLQKVPTEEYLCLMRAIKSSVWIKQISVCNSVVEKSKELLNTDQISQRGNPVLHVTGNSFQLSDKSLAAPWHQDWPALRTSKKTLVVWVPFGGAETQGALSFKVGSHRQGLFKTKEVGAVYEIDPDELGKFETVQKGMEAGDTVFFDSLTAHSSQSTDKLRMALSFRFEDLSCPEWKNRNFSSSHRDGIEKCELTDAENKIFE